MTRYVYFASDLLILKPVGETADQLQRFKAARMLSESLEKPIRDS